MIARNVRQERRAGIAATELAVCLPMIITIALGTMECCTMLFLKQSLTVAAYESIRKGIDEGGTNADVIQTAEQILTDRRVSGAEIHITPGDVSSIAAGEYIIVRIEAPCDQNNIFRGWFFEGRTVDAQVSMMKEF